MRDRERIPAGKPPLVPSRNPRTGGFRGTRAALFLVGFGAFLNLHAPQPLLPLFRQQFHASEFRVSLTISAPVLAVALVGPLGGFGGRFLAGVLSGPWGWPAGFLLLGVATLVCALAIGILLPPSSHFVRQHTAFLRVIGRHLRNPQLLATYAVGFNVLLTIVATFTYVNFYLADQPFHLGSSALSGVFAVYLLGAAITPAAGRLIDRFGYRRALIGAVGVSGAGILLTLVPLLPVIIAGLTLLATGVFAAQAAASTQVGRAADDARSSAAGPYLTLYYLGGAIGSAVPGLVWSRLGWPGCVAFVLMMQGLMAGIAYTQWTD